MSYGKNEKDQERVSSFRKESAAFSKSQPRTGGKAKIPAFLDEYKPSTSCIDTVRLIPGAYPQDKIILAPDATGQMTPMLTQTTCDFIKITEHFDGYYRKGAVCSAGPFNDREHRKACHGCDIYFATGARNENGRFESSRMSKQNKFVFSVWDYGIYHNNYQLDEHDNIRANKTTNKPYMQWQKCIGQGCPSCRAGNVETKQGCMRCWPLSYTWFQVLRQQDISVIGRNCVRCLGQNCISSLSWNTACCGACVVDMRTTQMTMEEINKITNDEYACQRCHTTGMLNEVYECGHCAQRGQYGVRASLFDVDLNVTVVQSGLNKNLQVTGFTGPNVIPDTWKEYLKPMDLIARYAPDSLEFQAKRFNVQPAPPQQGPQPQYPPQQQGYPAQYPQQQAMPPQQPQQTQGYMHQAIPQGYAPPPVQQPTYQPPPQQQAQPWTPQTAPAPMYPPQPGFGQPQQQAPVQPPQYAPPQQPQQGYPQGFTQQPAQPPPATPYGRR